MGDKEENPEALKIQGFWIFLCSYQCLTCGKQRLRNGVFANQMMSFEKDKEEPAVFFAKECELAEKKHGRKSRYPSEPGQKDNTLLDTLDGKMAAPE